MQYNDKKLPSSILTVDDVADFARFLVRELHLSFHPDDPFADYLDDKVLAGKLDTLMEQCFDVCEKANVDIYGVMGWPDEKPYDTIDGESSDNLHWAEDSIILKG